MLLSEEEWFAAIEKVRPLHGETVSAHTLENISKAIEAAILTRLAAKELPEPLSIGSSFAGVFLDVYLPVHLQQAHAQGFAAGAAAQLAHEPTALMWQHDETGRVGFLEAWGPVDMFKASNPRLRIVGPLYTRRESK